MFFHECYTIRLGLSDVRLYMQWSIVQGYTSLCPCAGQHQSRLTSNTTFRQVSWFSRHLVGDILIFRCWEQQVPNSINSSSQDRCSRCWWRTSTTINTRKHRCGYFFVYFAAKFVLLLIIYLSRHLSFSSCSCANHIRVEDVLTLSLASIQIGKFSW